MDFDTFISTAWTDHATDAAAVAQRLPEAVGRVGNEAQLVALATLAHHVHGEHLGRWRDGSALLARLAATPACVAEGLSGQTLRRLSASLALCAGEAGAGAGLGPSDRIRAGALAASNLAAHDGARAMHLLQGALDDAAQSGLDAADPMNRTLAASCNGIACTLEPKPVRSDTERALMILAAQSARHYWERAGGWLEVERAEYRLANTWLRAGDPARARSHAQACMAIVVANAGAALERLFAWEALGLGRVNTNGAQAARGEKLRGWRSPQNSLPVSSNACPGSEAT